MKSNFRMTVVCAVCAAALLSFASSFCFADAKIVEGKVVGTGPNKVWLNIGAEDGVAVDMVFEVRRGEEIVAKVKVRKAGKTSSEAEVIALEEGLSCAAGDKVVSTGEVKTEPKKEEPKKEEPKTEEVKPVETAAAPTSLTPTVTASTPLTTAVKPKKKETKKEEPKKTETKKEEPKKTEAKPKTKKRSAWGKKIKNAMYVILILGGTMVIQK